jgi:CheY-like chemotaxis protein
MAEESGSNPFPGKGQPSASPSPNPSAQVIPQRLILLLAEDNVPDALLVREAIKTENLPIETYIAVDGEQAVDFIANAGNDPDAPCPHFLLLDLNLPKIDGFEVLRTLRASDKCKNIPVLVVTSSDSPADRDQAAEFGARYFRKPVTYEEFLRIGPFLRTFLKETGLL